MQLPVNTTIIDSYRFVWQGRRDFAAFAFLPVLALSLVGALTFAFGGAVEMVTVNGREVAVPNTRMATGTILAALVNIVVYVMFSIAWHRRYLIGAESTTIGAALRWSSRHWWFLFRFVLIFLILIGVAIPVGFVVFTIGSSIPALAAPALLVMMVLVGLLYSRMLLVFPAIAIDQPMSFRQSFMLTNGNSFRMLGISILPAIPVMLAGLVVTLLLSSAVTSVSGPTLTSTFIVALVREAFAFAGIAVTLSALSIAYRDLTAQQPA